MNILLLYIIPLVCAAIADWKKRSIPDWTWIVILLIGGVSAFLFNTPYLLLSHRITGFLLPGICLLILAIRYGGVGGGDIKLTAAMGFCFGICGLAFILFFALIPAWIYASTTKQKSIPLAVFLCMGFFTYVGLSVCL